MTELLSPAGNPEKLRAAFLYGADAVYFAGERFGMRAAADNFTLPEIEEASAYAHERGRKLYITLNTMPREDEYAPLADFLRELKALGDMPDAAIVADIGVMDMIQKIIPDMEIHISTQANVMNAPTALHLHRAVGAERIVLSRELSMEDIRGMRALLPPELELEAFVHGAMCVAYSGRCLLSNALVGRSGNRGACAQPCRWQYHLMEEKRPGEYLPVCEGDRGTYLYSAYDLCMLPHLPELRDAGVISLKIEGRMKTAYYVASVVSVYRRALDLLELEGEEAFRRAVPDLMRELNKASHRQSNTGFYFGAPQPAAGAEGFSQTMEYVGDVLEAAVPDEPALIRLKNRFYVGDELEALTPTGSHPFTVGSMVLAETGESIQTASVAGTLLKLRFPFPVAPGDLLRGPNRNHQQG